MDGWSIETASSSWNSKATIPAGTSLEPGAFYLIGESDVPSEFADLTLDSNLSLGNASTGVDGVRLIIALAELKTPYFMEIYWPFQMLQKVYWMIKAEKVLRFSLTRERQSEELQMGVDTDFNTSDFSTNSNANAESTECITWR